MVDVLEFLAQNFKRIIHGILMNNQFYRSILRSYEQRNQNMYMSNTRKFEDSVSADLFSGVGEIKRAFRLRLNRFNK